MLNLRVENRVAHIELCTPPVNALSPDLVVSLKTALGELDPMSGKPCRSRQGQKRGRRSRPWVVSS